MPDSLHKDYFYMPDQTKKHFFKMKTVSGKGLVINHPYAHFDCEGNAAYEETYSITPVDDRFVSTFIRLAEENAGLKEDEYLWYETGYWSIKEGLNLYIGSGEEAVRDTISHIKSGQLVFCLDANDFCILINCKIKKGHLDGTAIVDIYCSALWRPFVEILEPFRKAIAIIGKTCRIHRRTNSDPKIKVSPFEYTAKNLVMVPLAVVPTHNGWIGPVVIKNNFGPLPSKYLFAQVQGGCLKVDFFRRGVFSFHGDLYKLGNTALIQGQFFCHQLNESETVNTNKSKALISYLDHFKS